MKIQQQKIREIGAALIGAGVVTLDDQAKSLGLCRSTTWTILKADHKTSGLSVALIRRVLAAPELPEAVRIKIREYIVEKVAGLYGHGVRQRSRFAARLGFDVSRRPTSQRRTNTILAERASSDEIAGAPVTALRRSAQIL